MQKVYIDEVKCAQLIKALENYRQEWDSKNKVYRPIPTHDWSSHAADCMRYMAVSMSKLRKESSPEELDRRYREAMYGSHSNFPTPFQRPY